MGSNTITVTYQLDGGSSVSQLLGSTLMAGATWTFTFSAQADLSACGPHTLKCWVARAGDVNHLNDTIQWAIQNDCTVVPGVVGMNQTVCPDANTGMLNLSGWMYGTILSWQSSTDGGSTWGTLSNTTTSQNFTDLTQTTDYRVIIDGGYCPDDTSAAGTVTLQALPAGGTVAGSDSMCITSVSGNLALSGNSGTIQQWESSTDNGVTWNSISNTSATQSYSGDSQTTLYRALIDGGVCPAVYSDTAEIYIDQLLGPVHITGSDTLCVTNASGTLNTSTTGTVLAWEYSTDSAGSWNGTSNTTSSFNYNLMQTTWYRIIVSGGQCPDGISDTAKIIVQDLYTHPTINSSDTLCISAVAGQLQLIGAASDVLDWETSSNDVSFSGTGQNAGTFDFSGQTVTTWYRTLMDGDACPDYYSDTVVIAIDSVPVPGVLLHDTTICYGSVVDFTLLGNISDSIQWQVNTGIGWTNLAGADSMTYAQSFTESSLVRVESYRGICPADASNNVMVDVNPLPPVNAGNDVTITMGDSTQLSGVGGSVGIWMPGSSLSDSIVQQPYASPLITTEYTYYGMDINGCVGTDEVIVTVLAPIDFIIRNVVTRNNDGMNDTWFIKDLDYFPNTAVKVFNQYGQLVYHNDNYDNSWKGDYSGFPLPGGTYLYVVTKGTDGQEFKGTLTLLGND